MEYIRPNITLDEATCHCGCGAVASDGFLDRLQRVREANGAAMPFRSIVRCPEHNSHIKGSKVSAHLLSAQPDPYGAADVGCLTVTGKQRRKMRLAAEMEGFNNFETCSGHMHFGYVPDDHPMYETEWWGISK